MWSHVRTPTHTHIPPGAFYCGRATASAVCRGRKKVHFMGKIIKTSATETTFIEIYVIITSPTGGGKGVCPLGPSKCHYYFTVLILMPLLLLLFVRSLSGKIYTHTATLSGDRIVHGHLALMIYGNRMHVCNAHNQVYKFHPVAGRVTSRINAGEEVMRWCDDI